MNGFFKIKRGINNLAIESDCHYVVPDIVDEELEWDTKPAFGGSLYGIKPFSTVGAKIQVPLTDDVTGNHDQAIEHELAPGDDQLDVLVAAVVDAATEDMGNDQPQDKEATPGETVNGVTPQVEEQPKTEDVQPQEKEAAPVKKVTDVTPQVEEQPKMATKPSSSMFSLSSIFPFVVGAVAGVSIQYIITKSRRREYMSLS